MIYEATEFTSRNGFSYTIKTPRLDEIEAIRELMIAVAETSPYILSTPESFRSKTVESQVKWLTESATSDKSIILAVYQNGVMKGLCDAGCYGDVKRKHRAILGISILESLRGQGIGMNLMKVLIEQIKKFAGVKIIELDVMTNNVPALAMYQKLGFIEAGRFPKAYLLPNGEVSDNLKMYLPVE